jgi:hypothetical protein
VISGLGPPELRSGSGSFEPEVRRQRKKESKKIPEPEVLVGLGVS